MPKNNKTLINGIFFLFLIIITYYFIFKDENMIQIIKQIKSLNLLYIIIAIIFMTIYFLIAAINVKNLLNCFNEKICLKKIFKYTLIAFFFSSITPASTGGEPMEVYCLSKENIKVSHSTMSLLIYLCGYHISSVSLGIIGLIFNPNVLKGNIIYFFILGSLLNTIPITLTFIGIFSQKLSQKIVNIVIKILKFFKFKNIDTFTKKINEELKIYRESAIYIKQHKKEFLKAIFLCFIHIIIFFSVPYFVYKSFGLSGVSILKFIAFQAILHSTVCSMPLPGSVGVTESIFLLIYGYIYPDTILESALLVNRFISFYLFVLIGLIIYIITKVKLEKNNQTK